MKIDAEWRRFKFELFVIWLSLTSFLVILSPFLFEDRVPWIWWVFDLLGPAKLSGVIAIFRSKTRMWGEARGEK